MDEERRRLERKAQADALAAGRYHVLAQRIGATPSLIPVVLPWGRLHERVRGRPEDGYAYRAWLICPHYSGPLVIFDERFAIEDEGLMGRSSMRFFERGDVVVLAGRFQEVLQVPAWFLPEPPPREGPAA